MPESDYYVCGVAGCQWRQTVRSDMIGLDVDTGHIIGHYKWHHTDIGDWATYHPSPPGIVFGDHWEYGPIPDDIAPTLITSDGDYTWREVKDYFKQYLGKTL
jgi:hypothetical protein